MDEKSLPDIPDHTRIERLLAELITAFHILHRQGVLDEYGHVSVRNPFDRSTFFTSSKPANLISSARDLDQWNIDGTPVADPVAGIQPVTRVSPFSEHWHHSSIFTRYKEVESVVHSHSPVMVAAGLFVGDVTLRPTYHMAGFVGVTGVPIFDASHVYEDMPNNHLQNMLINTKQLGDALAAALSSGSVYTGDEYPTKNLPEFSMVLERGHGFVTWATSLETAVYRAIYAQRNAEIQTKAQDFYAAAHTNAEDTEVLRFLTAREAQDSMNSINEGMPKAWPSWATDVKRCGLYVNKLAGHLS